MYLPNVTPLPVPSVRSDAPALGLVAQRIPFAEIPREAWDRLLAVTSSATPFSAWTVHRAWWDAYGATAHEQYLICLEDAAVDAPGGAASSAALDPRRIRAIVPLMHRHEVEPEDLETATTLRPRRRPLTTGVEPNAKAIFFGASYHADYATILAAEEDLAEVARALVDALAAELDPDSAGQAWDVVDLRRVRESDPALPILADAFLGSAAESSWEVIVEPEDVCPVLTLPEDGGWDAYLATLGRKERHEIRRKVRRAEAAGPLTFTLVDPTPEAVDRFIALHQERWGEEGLFPATAGGQRSRRFLHRLAELESAEGDARRLQIGQLSVGDRPIFSAVGFDDGATCYFYNAGTSRDARELSPGVTGTAAYLRDRLEAGRRRFDFLRGDEPYKYQWGAADEAIYRLLVVRREQA